jgi:hypothetical protein
MFDGLPESLLRLRLPTVFVTPVRAVSRNSKDN